MSRVQRFQNVMQRQAAKAGLTECGTQWLIEALDPFHDVQINPVGYPDTTASGSVIQVIKQSYQFIAPTATGNWDCSFTMMPWLNPITMNGNTINGAHFTPTQNTLQQANINAANNVTVGGLQFIAAASGTPLQIANPTNAGSYTNTSNTIPAQYLQGNGRCIAMGFEVCNTTAELNLQGLATVWRVPVPQNDDGTTVSIQSFNTGDTSNFEGSASVLYMPEPPTTIAAAQLFAGTQAWEAKYGSYQVCGFNTPDVPAVGMNFTIPVMYQTAQTDTAVITSVFNRNSWSGGAVAPAAVANVQNVSWTEMDMSGVHYTGLSNSTTLTVNTITYIERFPTQDDLDLIVSAKRSPEYDIKALEAYSEIYQNLPVGVQFGENGWGDWFDGIASAASSVLGSVGGTYGKAAATLIEGGKGFVSKVIRDNFDQPPSEVRVPNAPPMSSSSRAKQKKPKRQKSVADNKLRKDIAAARKALKPPGKRRSGVVPPKRRGRFEI